MSPNRLNSTKLDPLFPAKFIPRRIATQRLRYRDERGESVLKKHLHRDNDGGRKPSGPRRAVIAAHAEEIMERRIHDNYPNSTNRPAAATDRSPPVWIGLYVWSSRRKRAHAGGTEKEGGTERKINGEEKTMRSREAWTALEERREGRGHGREERTWERRGNERKGSGM